MTATRTVGIHLDIQVKLAMTNIMIILPKIYFPARWLVRAVIQNRDTRFRTEVESGFRILK